MMTKGYGISTGSNDQCRPIKKKDLRTMGRADRTPSAHLCSPLLRVTQLLTSHFRSYVSSKYIELGHPLYFQTPSFNSGHTYL